MPPRAGVDGDMLLALEAALRMAVFGAVWVLVVLCSDLEKVDEYMNGTIRQKALAIYFLLITFVLYALFFFHLVLHIYHVPSRFKSPRRFIAVFCLSGAICFVLWNFFEDDVLWNLY